MTPTSSKKKNSTTVAIYFREASDLIAIKRAAKRLGMPFTAFIRQGAKLLAKDVERGGKARAA